MIDLNELLERAKRDVAALEALGIDFQSLVVRSQPFGELIDSESRRQFTPPLDAYAYPICRALKTLALISKEFQS